MHILHRWENGKGGLSIFKLNFNLQFEVVSFKQSRTFAVSVIKEKKPEMWRIQGYSQLSGNQNGKG